MVFKATLKQYFSYIGQFYCWRKPEYPEKTIVLQQEGVSGKKINSRQCDQNFHWATYFTRSNRPAGDLQNLFGTSDFPTAFCEKALFGDKIIQ
jgi:hypothetical protein